MNSASQDFPHHLAVLRERMLHPMDYELAVNYFLEEFVGDAAFVRASDREPMSHLVVVLGDVVSRALGRDVKMKARWCLICANTGLSTETPKRTDESCCSSIIRMLTRARW
jgi:hypothetical protein